MITRAVLYPQHFILAISNPAESLFIGSFWLSISVIIGGIQVYGISYGPAHSWLIDAVYILYWVYAGCSLSNSIAQYWMLMHAGTGRSVPVTPSLFLVGYSAMLTGTIASLIAGSQPPDRAVLMIISGLAYKGYGWLISLVCIIYSIRNLLENGLPPPPLRPGMFIPVGSVAYTIVTFIGLAKAIPTASTSGYFSRHPTAKETLEIVALFVSIFMWLFAFWIFAIAVIANVSKCWFHTSNINDRNAVRKPDNNVDCEYIDGHASCNVAGVDYRMYSSGVDGGDCMAWERRRQEHVKSNSLSD
jgi:tellurite resistance protein TehA-like permease